MLQGKLDNYSHRVIGLVESDQKQLNKLKNVDFCILTNTASEQDDLENNHVYLIHVS
jgi:hypothetical protein